MGKKKGKNTKQSDENWLVTILLLDINFSLKFSRGDESVAENLLETVQASGEEVQNPVGKGKSGGGKKNKRKKQEDDDM